MCVCACVCVCVLHTHTDTHTHAHTNTHIHTALDKAAKGASEKVAQGDAAGVVAEIVRGKAGCGHGNTQVAAGRRRKWI